MARLQPLFAAVLAILCAVSILPDTVVGDANVGDDEVEEVFVDNVNEGIVGLPPKEPTAAKEKLSAYGHQYSPFIRVWACGEHGDVELREHSEKMSIHNRTLQAHPIDLPMEGLLHPSNKHVFSQQTSFAYKDLPPTRHHRGGAMAIAQLSFLLSQRVGRPLIFSPRALSLVVPTRMEEAYLNEANNWPRSTRCLADVLEKGKLKAVKIFSDSEDELEITLSNFRRTKVSVGIYKGTVFEQAFWTGRTLLVAAEDALVEVDSNQDKVNFKLKVVAIPLSASSPQMDHFHVTPFLVAFRRIMGAEEKAEREKMVARARRIEGMSDPHFGTKASPGTGIELDEWASYDPEADEIFLFRAYTGQLQPLEGEARGPQPSDEDKETEEEAMASGHHALFDIPPYFNLFGALHFRAFHHHRTGATSEAVARASAEDVRRLLERGDNVLAQDGRRRTALHVAAELNNTQAMEYILTFRSNYTDIIRAKRTMDPSMTDREAIRLSRQQEIADILKEALGDTKIADSIKLNELSAGAKSKKNTQRSNADDDDELREDEEARRKAGEEEAGDEDEITPEDLLFHADAEGLLPHHVACIHAHPHALRKLLEFNATLPSIPVYSNALKPVRNCLHLALKASQYEFHLPAILRVLEQLKDHVEREKALEDRIIEVIKLSVAGGADIHLKDAVDGATPLHAAVTKNQIRAAQHLIELGADAAEADRFGLPPLYRALQHDSAPALVGLLLDNGASATGKGKDGRSPIHWATGRRANCDVVNLQLLVQRGADMTEKDGKGRTPLHHAAQQGHFECVKYLIENGADVLARAADGRRPYESARGKEVIALLKSAAASRLEDEL